MLSDQVNTQKAILQEITHPGSKAGGIKVFLKREDLIDVHISGNKWYKLKYNLMAAKEAGYDTLLSFGGAYSNHIYALASAGKRFGFKTVGIIRGEEHLPLNTTLSFAQASGMHLYYMKREEYRRKKEEDVIEKLRQLFGNFYLIPEGGTNRLAVKGCSEIIRSINIPFDYMCTPCGTGGTIAGLISGSSDGQRVLGFPVLKGGEFLFADIRGLLSNGGLVDKGNWDLITAYHFGGYARYNSELLRFMEEFEETNKIPLDQVYTAKMMYGIYDLIRKNYFPDGSVIAAVHTGGIQGRLKNLTVINHPLP